MNAATVFGGRTAHTGSDSAGLLDTARLPIQAPHAHTPHTQPSQTIYIGRQTNGLAITSLVLSLLGMGVPGLALLSVISGHIALRMIRDSHDGGAGFAVVGLILSYAQIVMVVIMVALTLGTILWAMP